MRVRAIGHAGLEIEVSGLRILTDPWWAGPAFAGQWLPWPAPQPGGADRRGLDYVFLSSPRDNHLHGPTLRTLRPGAAALVPEMPGGRMARRLRETVGGWPHIVEMPHGRTLQLRRGVRATCYVNRDQSVLVLEDGDRVLVHAADALHTAPAAVIDHFSALLRSRHPPVDTLFSGYAAADWFPDCLRLPGKDDRAVARARGLLAAENWLRVVEALQPRLAVALPPGFALLEPHNRWIEEVRRGLPLPPDLHAARHGGHGTRCFVAGPGDVVDGVEPVSGTGSRPSPAGPDAAPAGPWDDASRTPACPPQLDATDLADLVARLDARVRHGARRNAAAGWLGAEIRLRENPGLCLHVERTTLGACAGIGPARRATVRLETRVPVLESVLDGGGLDPIVHGCGAVARLDDAEDLPALDALLGLLAPPRDEPLPAWRRRPLHELALVWRQRWPLALHLGARLGLLTDPHDFRHLDTPPAVEPDRRRAA